MCESLYFNICEFSWYYLLNFPTVNLDNVYVKYWSLDFHYLEQTVHIAIVKLFSPVVLMSEQSTSFNVPGDTAAFVKLVLFCRTAYGNLGNVLSAKGQYDEAETSYRKALQYRPNMADVHYNL